MPKDDLILKQCELVQDNMTTIAWIPAERIKKGVRVTLVGLEGWWTVDRVYEHGMPKDQLHTDRESHVIHDKDHHTKLEGLKLT
jgi:hypothetical protein